MTRPGPEDLRLQLRDSWNRKLYLWWDHYNRDYLGGALERPRIAVGEGTTRLGQWDGERRILTISAAHIERDAWLSVMETLRHEMAHQFAQEVLDAADSAPHGSAFRHACSRLRCRRSDYRTSSYSTDRKKGIS